MAKKYLVADLPGTYSLSANSDEEIITRDYIANGKGKSHCDSCMPKGGFKNMGIMWEVVR